MLAVVNQRRVRAMGKRFGVVTILFVLLGLSACAEIHPRVPPTNVPLRDAHYPDGVDPTMGDAGNQTN